MADSQNVGETDLHQPESDVPPGGKPGAVTRSTESQNKEDLADALKYLEKLGAGKQSSRDALSLSRLTFDALNQ